MHCLLRIPGIDSDPARSPADRFLNKMRGKLDALSLVVNVCTGFFKKLERLRVFEDYPCSLQHL
jgi:hypothetical protein